MNRYKSELTLAAVLLAIVLAVCYWQAPGKPMTGAEVEQYLQAIEQDGSAIPAPMRTEFLGRLRAWGAADDGRPVYMLNLMRYHEQLKPWPGVQLQAATPQAANAHYEDAVFGLAWPLGLSLTVGSNVPDRLGGSTALIDAGGADNWQRVLVVRYPSRRAFFQLISNPDYLKVMPYKFAALDVTLVPTDGATITPDLRLLAAAAALLVLLAFGWWRSVRRAAV